MQSGNPNKGDLTHTFTLVVRPSKCALTPEEYSLLDADETAYLSARRLFGHCLVTLGNERSEHIRYDFGRVGKSSLELFTELSLPFSVGFLGVRGMLDLGVQPSLVFPAAGVLAVAALSLMASSFKGAFIEEKESPALVEEWLEKKITAAEYEALKTWLDKRKERAGIYNVFFNNCAHFALRAARQAGIELPTGRGIASPYKIMQAFRKVADIYHDRPEIAVHTVADRVFERYAFNPAPEADMA